MTGRFQRTPEAWQALRAPSSLYDEHEAARAWQEHAIEPLRYLDPRDVLRDPKPPPPTTDQVLAHPMARAEAAGHWWKAVRPHVLEHHGALTADERAWVERYRPDRWLDELHPYTTETHLFGRDLT